MNTFKDDNFSIETTEKPFCITSFKIFVSPDFSQKMYKNALKSVKKHVSVPGFRKGHVPDSVVIDRYKASVEKEWKDEMVTKSYQAASSITKIYPISRESVLNVKIDHLSQQEESIVDIEYEHLPILSDIDLSQIKLPNIQQEPVVDEKVEETLEKTKEMLASWEEIIDREVIEGDFVDISVESLDSDPPKKIVDDRRFEVSSKGMAPWMKKLIIGLKIGESVEGTSELDENASEELKEKFHPTKVKITLNKILKIILPELTETLIRILGGDSLEDLKFKVRAKLEREAKVDQKKKLISAFNKSVLQIYKFDLPASLVNGEKMERLRIYMQNFNSLSDNEKKQKESDVSPAIEQEAMDALRLRFIYDQIIKQANISLSNQELNNALEEHARLYPEMYKKGIKHDDMRQFVSRISGSLLDEKAQDYILSCI